MLRQIFNDSTNRNSFNRNFRFSQTTIFFKSFNSEYNMIKKKKKKQDMIRLIIKVLRIVLEQPLFQKVCEVGNGIDTRYSAMYWQT